MDRIGVKKENRIVIAVGMRAADIMEDTGQRILEVLTNPGSTSGITPMVQDITVLLENWRFRRQIEHMYLFFNHYVSGATYRPKTVRLLPVDREWLKNLEGEFTKPAITAFRNALTNSEWVGKGSFTATLTNQPGKGTWPLVMGTFVILPRVTEKPEQTLPALKFFVWAFLNGDTLVQENNFVRLPDRVQSTAFKTIASIKDKAGNLIGIDLLNTSHPAK